MACPLRRLENIFRWPSLKSPASPCSPPKPPLLKLPVEITAHIAQFLLPASAASLAFTCRSALETLGTTYWQVLREVGRQQELEQFLSLLETDLPDHVLCYHCLILHCSNNGGHRGTACYRAELLGGVYNYIHKNVTFDIFRATMKCYRQGLNYSRLLERFETKIISCRSIENFPYRFLSLAKFIDRSLLLRVQETLLFPNGLFPQIPINGRISICAHVSTVGTGFEARLPVHMQCKLDHNHDVQQCVRSSGIRQCVYCPTEFQIELQDCERFGIAVVVTKWLDLGEGRSVRDPKWWSRLSKSYTDHDLFAGMRGVYKEHLEDRLPVPSELTSIRATFEAERDMQLTLHKVNELFGALDQSTFIYLNLVPLVLGLTF
ncbi:hypothetical protein BKA61DRAFT_689329 [Leptodontidium sp. MPI-SDFR-AT-0119]|nr:hypothetical protein BKA61DRAFT_689329 [Leptodontidium sp. MPI-SDFR-AT-0119]